MLRQRLHGVRVGLPVVEDTGMRVCLLVVVGLLDVWEMRGGDNTHGRVDIVEGEDLLGEAPDPLIDVV